LSRSPFRVQPTNKPTLGISSRLVSFKHPLIPILLIGALSYWTSAPFYIERFRGLGPPLGPLWTWQIATIIIPLVGIAGGVYGRLSGEWFWALLIGIIPYVPTVFLGTPFILFLGVPMGLIGAGCGLSKNGKRDRDTLLVIIGMSWWAILAFQLISANSF